MAVLRGTPWVARIYNTYFTDLLIELIKKYL